MAHSFTLGSLRGIMAMKEAGYGRPATPSKARVPTARASPFLSLCFLPRRYGANLYRELAIGSELRSNRKQEDLRQYGGPKMIAVTGKCPAFT